MMELELMVGLAPATFAIAYYAAQAGIFKAPRDRLDKAMAARAKTIAQGIPSGGPQGWRRGGWRIWARGWTAVSLEFWRSMLRCRKCWAQWASWAQLCVLRGAPWSWTWEEFAASVGAAGIAIWAYEITQMSKPKGGR